MAKRTRLTSKQVGQKYGFRSGLEEKVAAQLTSKGIKFKYEEVVLPYTVPASQHKYTPDFLILDNGIIVETKGRFLPADRKKHLLIKQQYPDLDLRFVFTNSSQKLYKGSKTTYAAWAERYGFKYADKTIPDAWLKEKGKAIG